MSVYGRGSSLIPVENFARGGLWGATGPAVDTTPALHRRVVEETSPEVPSALHPRVPEAAPKRRRRAPVKKPRDRKRQVETPAPEEVRQAVDAVAATLRAEMEPSIVAQAEQLVAGKVLELFGVDR